MNFDIIVDGGFLEYTIFQEICGNKTHAQTVVTRRLAWVRGYTY